VVQVPIGCRFAAGGIRQQARLEQTEHPTGHCSCAASRWAAGAQPAWPMTEPPAMGGFFFFFWGGGRGAPGPPLPFFFCFWAIPSPARQTAAARTEHLSACRRPPDPAGGTGHVSVPPRGGELQPLAARCNSLIPSGDHKLQAHPQLRLSERRTGPTAVALSDQFLRSCSAAEPWLPRKKSSPGRASCGVACSMKLPLISARPMPGPGADSLHRPRHP